MDSEEKCDIENPCDDGFSCDLDKLRCVSTDEQPIPLPPGIIETNIGGSIFVGKYETILRIIASHYGKLKDEDIKCSTGLDVMEVEFFNDKIFTTLQDEYSDLISFVDIGSGKILCAIKSQLIQYWKGKLEVQDDDEKRGSYRGFEAQLGEDVVSKKLQIMREEIGHTLYLNFELWPTKFITDIQARKIKNSQDNLFLLIPTQFRYYDTNPHYREGAHHNWDRKTDKGGDSLYIVAGIKTIGKELIEAEREPLEILHKITGKRYSNVKDVKRIKLDSRYLRRSELWGLQSYTMQESLEDLINIINSIGIFTNLRQLQIEDLDITSLPESIGNLINLTWLIVRGNKLETLPESIGNLTELEVLQLENNQLETLPESIGNLTNLTYLDLSINKLETLPESIGNLTNLTELNLYNNPQLDRESIPENLRDVTEI